MIINKTEVEELIIVHDPKLSLKQFLSYIDASEKGRKSILLKSKYPGKYIPRFYEMARKIACETFSLNIDGELYATRYLIESGMMLNKLNLQ